MPKRKYSPGTFLRVPLSDGSFGYGRLLEYSYIAFYRYRTVSPDSDLSRIASAPVLFKTTVRQLAFDEWELLGWRELEDHLKQPVILYTQDVGNPRLCTIFDTAGNERVVEPQECVGLERAIVWEKESIEERLLDALLGRPNADEEYLRARLR